MTMISLYVIMLAFLARVSLGFDPYPIWYAGIEGSEAGADTVASDAEGNLIFAGGAESASVSVYGRNGQAPININITTGSRGGQFIVVKYSPTGTILWTARTASLTTSQRIMRIATDINGNIYCAGTYDGLLSDNKYQFVDGSGAQTTVFFNSTSSHFLTKLTPDGKLSWTRSFAVFIQSWPKEPFVATLPNGLVAFFVVGYSQSVDVRDMQSKTLFTASTSSSSLKNAFIFVFDNDGNKKWTSVVTNIDMSFDYRAVLAPNAAKGKFLIAGQFTQLSSPTYETNGRTYNLTRAQNQQNTAAFILSIDLDGRLQWYNVFTAADDVYPGAVAADLDGNVVFAGYSSAASVSLSGMGTIHKTEGNVFAFLIKITDTGNKILWQSAINGGSMVNSMSSIAVIEDGIFTAGFYNRGGALASSITNASALELSPTYYLTGYHLTRFSLLDGRPEWTATSSRMFDVFSEVNNGVVLVFRNWDINYEFILKDGSKEYFKYSAPSDKSTGLIVKIGGNYECASGCNVLVSGNKTGANSNNNITVTIDKQKTTDSEKQKNTSANDNNTVVSNSNKDESQSDEVKKNVSTNVVITAVFGVIGVIGCVALGVYFYREKLRKNKELCHNRSSLNAICTKSSDTNSA